MDKQIAIDILEKEKAYMQQHAGKAQVEAFDMAICALKINEQEIRNKVIEELKELVRGHKYTNAEDGTTVEEMLKDENTEKKYAWHLSNNECCDWMLHRLDEIAEQMKEVIE